jgi:aminopeptidase-like protein
MESRTRLTGLVQAADLNALGSTMHLMATRLWPIARSITGQGVRDTLEIIKEYIPSLSIRSVPSGTQCFDWVVPEEWTIFDAFIEDESGNRIVEYSKNNLHVVAYSIPVDQWLNLEQLQLHLHSLPSQPNAIPYVTSYYERGWGFCLADEQRRSLKEGQYRAVIRSALGPGVLNYGELILPGETDEEILLSTYLCHPSLANELSGPVVTTAIARLLRAADARRYTYRIIFVPETIGSIVYLSMHLARMKERTIAGYVINCVGDERTYSYVPSRHGDTLADFAAQHVLRHLSDDYKAYSFLDRGSDERQYCSPGIDLPVASVMRSKYAAYPEYHTSLDDLKLVTPAGLAGGFLAYARILECLEANCYPKVTVLCEPALNRHCLYPTRYTDKASPRVLTMLNVMAYADGSLSLLEIAGRIGEPMWKVLPIVAQLSEAGLLELDATMDRTC